MSLFARTDATTLSRFDLRLKKRKRKKEDKAKFGQPVHNEHKRKEGDPPTCVHRGTSSSTGSDSSPHLSLFLGSSFLRIPPKK